MQTEAEPWLLEVDPEFDLFRLLDPRETAPSIGQIFGEQDILAVLPSAASAKTQAAYRELAESWQSDAHGIDIRLDTELEELPADKAAWFFGADNLWAQRLFGGEDAQDRPSAPEEAVGETADEEPAEYADEGKRRDQRKDVPLAPQRRKAKRNHPALYPSPRRSSIHFVRFSLLVTPVRPSSSPL